MRYVVALFLCLWGCHALAQTGTATGMTVTTPQGTNTLGTWINNLNTGTGTTSSGSLVTATGGTTARTLAARAADVINAADYGMAPGNTGAVNKADLVAAISVACSTLTYAVTVPGNSYSMDVSGGEILDQCSGTNNAVSIVGNGLQSTFFGVTGNNNFIHMAPPGGQANNGHALLANFRVFDNTNSTSGAAIALDTTNTVTLENLELDGKFTGVDCVSCVGTVGTNLTMSGTNSTSNASLMKFRRASNASTNINPSENFFSNLNARAGSAGGYTNAIIINDIDGLFITNSHIGFSSGAIILVQPGFNASGGGTSSDQIDGIHLTGTDLDTGSLCLDFEHLTSFSGVITSFMFSGGSCSNSTGDGVKLNDSSATNFTFSGFASGGNQGNGWNLAAGTGISIVGGFENSNNLSAGGGVHMNIAGSVSHVVVSGASFSLGNATSMANDIAIGGSADYVAIGLNDYGGSSANAVGNTSSGTHIQTQGVTYVGPGDIVGGASAWWGLRGYSSAQAIAGTKAANIIRASDSATTDITILPSGAFDVATATTFCASTTCKVVTLYDQTGGGYNVTQATSGKQPALTFNCLGALPCLTYAGSQVLVSSSAPTVAQPVSVEEVAQRTVAGRGSFQSMLSTNGGNTKTQASSANNTWDDYFGASISNAATDGVFHVGVHVANQGNSVLNVDNATTGTQSGGANGIATAFDFGSTADGSEQLTGMMIEGGWWPLGFNTQQQTNACHNAYVFWGTPTAC